MLHEWKDNLIVVSDKKDQGFEAEIFMQMETFAYLAILPSERLYYRHKAVIGETAADALDKAKGHLRGQLGLFKDEFR